MDCFCSDQLSSAMQCAFRTMNTAISAHMRDAMELTTFFQLVISLFILYIEHNDRSHLNRANETKRNKSNCNVYRGWGSETKKDLFIYLLIGKRLAMQFVHVHLTLVSFFTSRCRCCRRCCFSCYGMLLGMKKISSSSKNHTYT